MSNLFRLDLEHLSRIAPLFPIPPGFARFDKRADTEGKPGRAGAGWPIRAL
ncbi:MAG: hypothetical protein AAGG56_15070 [Pseudomonadota bacterium]